MLFTFIVTVTTSIDGTTLFGPPVDPPSAQLIAAPETGVMSFSVANAGILNPVNMVPYVGRGGWLLAGVSLNAPQIGGRIGIIQPNTFSTQQDIVPLNAVNQPWQYRPTYVPAGWRLRFNGGTVGPGTLRIDVCPLRDFKTAVRAIAATRLIELVPNAA